MTDNDHVDEGAGEGAGTGTAAAGHGLSALSSQLGAGLAALSERSSLPPPVAPPPSPPPSSPPTPSPPTVVQRVVAAPSAQQRVPDAAALRVADRILSAAGHAVRVVEAPVAAAASPAPPVSNRSLPTPAFVVTTPDGRSWPLVVGQSLTIGRDGTLSDIAIDNPEISRRHVTVSVTPSGPTATDLGSTNGTSVVRNGVWHDLLPNEPMALAPGDRLAVPDDIWLVVVEQARAMP